MPWLPNHNQTNHLESERAEVALQHLSLLRRGEGSPGRGCHELDDRLRGEVPGPPPYTHHFLELLVGFQAAFQRRRLGPPAEAVRVLHIALVPCLPGGE